MLRAQQTAGPQACGGRRRAAPRRAACAAAGAGGKPAGFGAPPPAASSGAPSDAVPGYWNALRKSAAAVEATPKQRLPLILGSRSVMLWWAGGRVYCTAAASPPWSFPLVDAQLSVVDGRPAVRSTLDGSLFDLQSGEALEWCPREEAAFSFRNLLSAAKAKEPKQRLPIYALRQALSGDLEVFFPVQP